jgi:basic amino acid/polyamine antiporter, APA family
MADEGSSHLKRTLGFWALVVYGVGDILGAGIYALVGKIAGISGSLSWLSFAVAMGVASITALSYAELGSRFPRSGGAAHFCAQAFRRREPALMVGWLVLCSGMVSMATSSRALAGYLQRLAAEHDLPAPLEWPIIAGFLLLLAGVNFWGMRSSSITNLICTSVEVSGLMIVIVAGAMYLGGGHPAVEQPATEVPWLNVLSGAALAFFAFIGFEDLVNVSEEVQNPERNVPAAIVTALAIASVVYITVVIIAVAVVPLNVLAASKGPLLEVVTRAAPWMPISLFSVIAMFAVANTSLLNFIMGSRLLYGMSQEKLLPAPLSNVHPTRGTPYVAILLILAIVIVLALTGDLGQLASTTSTLLLLVFFTVHLSLVVVKLRRTDRAPSFRVPLAVPVFGIAATLGLVAFVSPEVLIPAGIILAIGAAIVLVQRVRLGPADPDSLLASATLLD